MKNLLAKAVVGSLLSVSTVQGATQSLSLEVSVDGITWSSEVTTTPLGDNPRRVLFRALVRYHPESGDVIPLGFGNMNSQPVVSNVRGPSIDRIVPFITTGSLLNGQGVVHDSTPMDGPFGRMMDVSLPAITTAAPMGVHYHSSGSGGAPQGAFYRIARSNVTNWIGVGPSTGSNAANNYTNSGGVVTSQRNPSEAGYVRGLEIELYRFAIDIGFDHNDPFRTLEVDVPLRSIVRADGVSTAGWDMPLGSPQSVVFPPITVSAARVTLIPAPGTVVVLLGAMVALPRRRT